MICYHSAEASLSQAECVYYHKSRDPHIYISLVRVIPKFNGTSTPKGSYSAKNGDNDCNVNSIRYSVRTALCESIRYQAKSEQNVRQDLIPRGATGRLLSYPLYIIRHSTKTIRVTYASTVTNGTSEHGEQWNIIWRAPKAALSSNHTLSLHCPHFRQEQLKPLGEHVFH